MEPIRILQVVPNMNAGGLENLIMNIYRNIDRKKVQFDFLVHYEKRCDQRAGGEFCLPLAVFRVQLYSVGKPVFRPCDACSVHHDQHPDHPHQKTGAAAHGERKGKNAREPLARGFPRSAHPAHFHLWGLLHRDRKLRFAG